MRQGEYRSQKSGVRIWVFGLLASVSCLLTPLHASWNPSVWPQASNHPPVTTVSSGTVTLVTGSTAVDATSTGWQFNTSNFPQRVLVDFTPTAGLWLALYEQTNTWIKTAALVTNPATCADYLLVTNTIVLTNASALVACAFDPVTAGFGLANRDGLPLNCALTNLPQLAGTDYTPLVTSTNYFNDDGSTNAVTVSAYVPTTNANLSGYAIWALDTTLALNEREAAANISPYTALAIPTSANTATALTLPACKAWVLAHAGSYAITQFADDGHSDFTGWVGTVQTNPVFRLQAGQLWWSGTNLFTTTNTWTAQLFHRLPPTWDTNATLFWLDASNQLTTVGLPVQPVATLTMQLCILNDLPMDLYAHITTNWGTFPGWMFGQPLVYQTNAVLVTTNVVSYSDFFSYTPRQNFTGANTGHGHVVTNTWTFRNTWLSFARVNYTVADDGGGTGNWLVVAAPISNPDVTDTNTVVTNTLAIADSPLLALNFPYYSNGWANVITETYVPSAGTGFTVPVVNRPFGWPVEFNNTALYTRQAASLSNWTIAVTSAVMSLTFTNQPALTNIVSITGTNCVTVTNTFTWQSSTSVTNVYDGSNLTGTVSYDLPNVTTSIVTVCGTNSLTNAVFASATYSQFVAVVTWQPTNVASVALAALEQDWASTNVWTNLAIYVSLPVPPVHPGEPQPGYYYYTPSPATDATWRCDLYIAANQTLLSVLLTNPVNFNTVSAVLTNYYVAAGTHEIDYQWDGVHTALAGLTVLATNVNNFWQGQDGWLLNRYGSNQVSTIVDTNLLGYFTPALIVTDTLANAESAQTFTNAPAAPPSGYTYAAPAPGLYLKDIWQAAALYTTWTNGTVVYVANSYSYAVIYPHGDGTCTCDSYSTNVITDCDSASNVTALADAALAKKAACIFNNLANTPHIVALDNPANTESDFGGSQWGRNIVIAPNPCWNVPGFPGSDTNTFEWQVTNNLCGHGYLNGTPPTPLPTGCPDLSAPAWCPAPANYFFWHGQTPSNSFSCCNIDGINYAAASFSWLNLTNDVADTVPSAYGFSAPVSNYLGVTLAAQQQSSAGIFTDVATNYTSTRVVYVPTIPATGYGLNTNILPVQLVIGTITVPVTNTAAPPPPPNCTNQFTTAYTWYLGHTALTWPVVTNLYYFYTGLLSNQTVTVTNALWSTQGVWTPPAALPANSFDLTNQIGSYARLPLAPSFAATNLAWQTDYLSNTLLIPYPTTPDGILRGWGLGANVMILEDYAVTNGFNYRSNP